MQRVMDLTTVAVKVPEELQLLLPHLADRLADQWSGLQTVTELTTRVHCASPIFSRESPSL